MTGAPEVSVVIPTRNRWRLVAGAVEMALRQEDVDLEVVVVDDGSTDGTPSRLRERDDPRLSVLTNGPDRGVARARNHGIEQARGKWVAFLDDDDIWAPRKLRAQLDGVRRGGAGFAYCGGVSINEEGELVEVQAPPPARDLWRALLSFNAIPCGCSNVMARTELVRWIGGFDDGLAISADWDLWIRLSLTAEAAAVSEPLIAYVEHAENMHVRRADQTWHELDYLSRKHRDWGFEADGVWLSRWIAGGQRAAGERLAALRSYLRGAAHYRSLGNVLRAAGVLFGERAMGLVRRAPAPAEVPPDWLPRAWARRRLAVLGRPPADGLASTPSDGERDVLGERVAAKRPEK